MRPHRSGTAWAARKAGPAPIRGARPSRRLHALVNISCDEHKKALTDSLAKEPMPWTHWWNGPDGGILTTWKVDSYPTICVLDAKGVIRHKDLRGEELEMAVNTLLKEAETKTSG